MEMIVQALILAGSSVFSYWAGGRSKQKADFLTTVAGIYDNLAKTQEANLLKYQAEIDSITKKCDVITDNYNRLHLAYAKEVERSQNWEKLHREQKEANDVLKAENGKIIELNQLLIKENTELKHNFEQLRTEFDKHKLQTS